MNEGLDRFIKIGGVTMPRWLAGRDALAGELDSSRDVDGRCDGYLIHQSEPRFICRWTVHEDGAPARPLVYSSPDDEGDALEFYDFVWTDDPPGEDDFRTLMNAAVEAVDNFIGRLNEEYE